MYSIYQVLFHIFEHYYYNILKLHNVISIFHTSFGIITLLCCIYINQYYIVHPFFSLCPTYLPHITNMWCVCVCVNSCSLITHNGKGSLLSVFYAFFPIQYRPCNTNSKCGTLIILYVL